jgi:hypothetical protein
VVALAPIPTAPIIQTKPSGAGAPPPKVETLPPRHLPQLPHKDLPAAATLNNGSTASAPAGGGGAGGSGAGGIY